MFGRFVLIGSAAAVVGAVIWVSGVFRTPAVGSKDESSAVGAADDAPAVPVEIGAPLYAAIAVKTPEQKKPAKAGGVAIAPVAIHDCRLMVNEKEEVPAQKDGRLWFVGTEIKPGEVVPPDLLIEIPIGGKNMKFKRLKEGDIVERGQLLAQLDDRVARSEVGVQQSKIVVAEADRQSSEKHRDEAKAQYDTALKLNSKDSRAMALEQVQVARLAWDKYYYEEVSKRAQIELAKQEANKAEVLLGEHEIRSSIRGRIKTIYKNPGEAVKSAPTYEPVFLIHNLDEMKIEGLVEKQYLGSLQSGMKVIVEPTLSQGPIQTLIGHLQEVTGVAVTNEKAPRVVSSSLDHTVRIWDITAGTELRKLQHPVPVRALACTPVGAKGNLCVSGSADGTLRIWDLSSNSPKPLHELTEKHRGAVNCVAFSPDGQSFASGGDDREINVWETDTGKLRYRLSGHSGAVTSLQFTPQVKLVSAGRDNTLRLWSLGTLAGRLDATQSRRSGDITQIGVSPDGQRVLFDPYQSKSLRILSVADGVTEGVLRNHSPGTNFSRLAIFSPDARTILTGGTSEGRFQLWRAPSPTTRAHVLRQLMSEDQSAPTCGSFSPDGNFIVTGNQDHNVMIWPMPTESEMDQELTAVISNIEPSVDSSSQQVRIVAELKNEGRRLLPGDIVTMVRYFDR